MGGIYTMYARDFRRIAREALAGRWALALAVGLVAAILGATVGSGTEDFFGNVTAQLDNNGYFDTYNSFFSSDLFRTALPLILMLASFAGTLSLIRFVLGGPISLGYAKFSLGLVDRREVSFSDLFSKMDCFGKGFLMKLLMGIYITLWTLLLIVPGIMKAYSYAMTPYILAENPQMGANEAITASKNLMYGKRWRLFCLQMSFIGWALLSALTLGVGTLWLRPYEETATAAFYRQICYEESNPAGAFGPEFD